MTEAIIQHAHCHICGKAISFSEIFCSEGCKEKYASMMKKRKIFMLAINVMIGIIIILIFIMSK